MHINLMGKFVAEFSFFNYYIVENFVASVIFTNLSFKDLLKDLKLILETLVLQVHLHLSFIHEIENALLGLFLWDFYNYLRVLLFTDHDIVI